MRDFRNTSLRYCPHLGQNVIMETKRSESGTVRMDCLNKEECGFCEKGCRNLLIERSLVRAEERIS